MNLDPITILGIALKRPVPTGEPFVEWLLDEGGIPEFVDALHAHSESANSFFFWDEVAGAINDLSRQRWTPLPAYVQSLYAAQGGRSPALTEAALA